ncbi:MAG: hypothetical protein EOO61_08810 [Hymenobacter sp.]|nr:MAG: hypothetical protein EOO61_08810 [Hymenobacter sp.]
MSANLTVAMVELVNGIDVIYARQGILPLQKVKRTMVEMRVVNEAGMPCINEVIADILNLLIVEKQIVRTASGELIELDVANYVEIGLNNHWDTCRALVLKGNSIPTISSARVKNLTQPYVRI